METKQLRARLEATRSSGGFAPEVVAALGEHLSSAAEDQLFRMSPLRYGRARGLGDREATDLFLHATRAGLLEFSWGVVCPGCAGFITTESALRHLRQQAFCAFCRVPIPVAVDDNAEVAFTVSPAVRRIRLFDPDSRDLRAEDLATFFSTSVRVDSPFHRTLRGSVVASATVARGQTLELDVALEPGRYVLIAPVTHGVLHLDSEGGGATADVDILSDRIVPAELSVAAGPSTLRVTNRSGRTAVVALVPDPVPHPEARPKGAEPPGHDLEPYLTAKALINVQTFRDLFRTESLPGDVGIELKALTLLFTDLASSTALYEEVGDLRAYALVREHFDVLRSIVASRGGAVVKTIGDAIMASFAEATPGMEAAVAMLGDIRSVGTGDKLAIKVGLHTGPCIAVEQNERLDYFGRTVNMAARVQGLASGQEIVCTEAAWTDDGVRAAAAELSARRDRARLKGIDGEVPVVRLR